MKLVHVALIGLSLFTFQHKMFAKAVKVDSTIIIHKQTDSTATMQVVSLLEEAQWKDSVFVNPTQVATYVGGQAAWQTFLQTHVKYLKKPRKKPCQEKVCFSFIIRKDGKPEAFKWIGGRDYASVEQVLDALHHMPYWQPAEYKGIKVDTWVKVEVEAQK